MTGALDFERKVDRGITNVEKWPEPPSTAHYKRKVILLSFNESGKLPKHHFSMPVCQTFIFGTIGTVLLDM